jgi:SAM-dependent methyltransferase
VATSDRSRVRAYYAAFGDREWERLERPADGAVEFAVTTAALERHLPPGSRILDIGGGPGRYALWLADRAHTVSLADLSPELLAIARGKISAAPGGDRVVEVIEADACDLSRWPAATFDAALSLGPFYHLIEAAERTTAARELARVVRPGGLVFVAAIPRLAYLTRTVGLADEHHHLLDPAWLDRLLVDGVFENEIPGRFGLGYGVQPGELEALLAGQGFEPLEMLSAESLSVGVEAQVGEVIATDDRMSRTLLRILMEHAGDDRLLGITRHVLFVGRRAA